MRVVVQHRSRYHYPRPALLGPQLIRLRPADHTRARIESYQLLVEPEHRLHWLRDPHGNRVARVTFKAGQAVSELDVLVEPPRIPHNARKLHPHRGTTRSRDSPAHQREAIERLNRRVTGTTTGTNGESEATAAKCGTQAADVESDSGADGRTRTDDLLITNQLLYQLSYVSADDEPATS